MESWEKEVPLSQEHGVQFWARLLVGRPVGRITLMVGGTAEGQQPRASSFVKLTPNMALDLAHELEQAAAKAVMPGGTAA